ncbi:outer membrane lipoprotein-sorting protein [Vulgatibacter sp.]|uniref:outer membrane lipoprotein-sorting protein n=1 Tax=Vulgatibacter sp. TaxID=1971226 RepID=UPI003566EF7E
MHKLLFALAALAVALPTTVQALTPAETLALLKEQDLRQQQTGDYQALAFIERKEKDKNDLVYEAVVYRRDETDKLVILFLQPKEEAGKGYLRIDKSMFFYDPTVGKWERKTERERIAGTDSRRQDFDESRLAEEYDAKWIGDVKLGRLEAHHLELKAKPGVDVAYPVLQLWIDKKDHNLLKRQEFALSGRLMRTQYFPKWTKLYSESKKGDVWIPKEQRIFDEVEKGNKTTIVIRSVDLKPVSDAYFTKAWLESKSR